MSPTRREKLEREYEDLDNVFCEDPDRAIKRAKEIEGELGIGGSSSGCAVVILAFVGITLLIPGLVWLLV